MNPKNLLTVLAVSSMMFSCTPKAEDNPFITGYDTEFGVPPFDKIEFRHYEPAFMQGMEEQNRLIDSIISNPDAPTFDNTIAALDNSSPILDRVSSVFYCLEGADTNDSIDALSMKIAPLLSEHSDNITLNKKLFERINAVYQQKESMSLTTEQLRLLDDTYKDFVRSGANLPADKQERLRAINKELSTLGLTFSKNLLAEDNEFKLFVDNKERLSGLPDWFVQTAAEEAKAEGKEGQWLFTLRNASRTPLLQYADDRSLREAIYKAYINRCNNNDKNDNKKIISQIVKLRLEKAQLLGYDCYASLALDNTMAKNPANAMDLLNKLWAHALPKAKAEAAELQKMMDKEGRGEKLEAWDWFYYTEKLRAEKYAMNEEDVKPYFKLENVLNGAFTCANKLYGITFTPINNIPTYNPDVMTFEVKDADGSHLGVFYADYFPRAGKEAGAWMGNLREEQKGVRPLIYNVANFTKPVGDTPSLLTIDEVETLFHELGHALQGLMANTNYKGNSGTNVSRDYVELPSQFNEHWSMEPEVLKMYAHHYQTGEVIPDSLIAKVKRQATFNQGFQMTELIAAALLDMNLHMLTSADDLDVTALEKKSMDAIGLIPEIAPRYRVTYFNHIIGGYAAGYYSYLWANVLDNDAFEAFRENGIFDKATADLFRHNVLEKGGTEDPMTLYKNFRGAEPSLEPMLRNLGMD
jgi:peptidyl-dipeptidase Dcp